MERPKTAEEVMSLPIYDPLDSLEPTRLRILGIGGDEILFAWAGDGQDGVWQPVQIDGVWMRQRGLM